MKKYVSLFLFVLLSLLFNSADAQRIVTYAGNGITGYTDSAGVATNAEFNRPRGLLLDSKGNLYISDHVNSCIRKITAAGVISTFAGTTTMAYGGDGGPATAAMMMRPAGLAMDAAGNLYVTDATDNRIRKIDTAGIITTVAGTGVAGYTGDGGADTAATFNTPTGIAIDASGNLYVADSGNNVVRKINTSGIITTFAGTGAPGYAGDGGPATAANLTAPMSVAIDGAGNLLIADYRNNVVRKVNTSMVITTIAGNDTAGFAGDGGPATAAEFNSPNSIAFDRAGNIYISDENNQRIRIIDASGKVTTVAGSGYAGYSGDNGGALDAQFYRPMGLAIDTSNNIFIADFINSVIREVKMITLATAMPHGVTGNSSMSLYPDPADNKLNVTFSDYIAGPIKMQIQSIMGQKIYETTTRENHVLADVSTLPSGCYIINCYDRGSKFASGRFIKR